MLFMQSFVELGVKSQDAMKLEEAYVLVGIIPHTRELRMKLIAHSSNRSKLGNNRTLTCIV